MLKHTFHWYGYSAYASYCIHTVYKQPMNSYILHHILVHKYRAAVLSRQLPQKVHLLHQKLHPRCTCNPQQQPQPLHDGPCPPQGVPLQHSCILPVRVGFVCLLMVTVVSLQHALICTVCCTDTTTSLPGCRHARHLLTPPDSSAATPAAVGTSGGSRVLRSASKPPTATKVQRKLLEAYEVGVLYLVCVLHVVWVIVVDGCAF